MSKQKKRKVPMRKDIVSGEMYPKKELVRIVKTKENEVLLDSTGRQNGRGAYIALEPELAIRAKQQKTLDRVFGMKIPEEFYDELYEYIDYQKARQELIEK